MCGLCMRVNQPAHVHENQWSALIPFFELWRSYKNLSITVFGATRNQSKLVIKRRLKEVAIQLSFVTLPSNISMLKEAESLSIASTKALITPTGEERMIEHLSVNSHYIIIKYELHVLEIGWSAHYCKSWNEIIDTPWVG